MVLTSLQLTTLNFYPGKTMSTFRQDAEVYGGVLSAVDNSIKQFAQAMAAAKSQLDSAKSGITAAETVATDVVDVQLTASVAKVNTQLASDFTSTFGGINTLAQFIADLSETAGLDGGANELRLFKNDVKVSVSQDA